MLHTPNSSIVPNFPSSKKETLCQYQGCISTINVLSPFNSAIVLQIERIAPKKKKVLQFFVIFLAEVTYDPTNKHDQFFSFNVCGVCMCVCA